MWEQFKKWYRSLPDKKIYFELLGAVLTVPVLITVILLNLNNLNAGKSQKNATSPTPIVIVATQPPNSMLVKPQDKVVRASPPISCKRQIGPISISSPREGEVVSANPVCITIAYVTGEYCGVQWSVKVNDGPYSEYSDRDVCIYNMPSGSKSVSVKVRNVDTNAEIILQRNFTYTGGSTQAISPTQSASSSAGFNQ